MAELERSGDESYDLRRELERRMAQESQMEELRERMEDIAETNRLLTLELEDKGRKMKTLEAEKDSIAKTNESLVSQKEADQLVLRTQREKLDSRQGEVQYLSDRHIDPNLEDTIMKTQGMIRESLQHFSPSKISKSTRHSASSADYESGEAEGGVSSKLADRLQLLCTEVDSLVTRSADAIVYFEQVEVWFADIMRLFIPKSMQKVGYSA